MTGIYIIKNSINKKLYIGSSACIKDRWSRHKQDLIKNKHHSKPLQNFVNKYGIGTIYFEVIELCKKQDLLMREQYYIDTLNPYFNTCKIAGNKLGYVVSDETKHKISIKLKGIKRKKTNEQIEKHRESMIGKTAWNKGIKMRELSNKGKIILQFDMNNNFIKEWKNAKEVEKEIKISRRNIGQCCLNKRNSAGNFKWKYKINNLIGETEKMLKHFNLLS